MPQSMDREDVRYTAMANFVFDLESEDSPNFWLLEHMSAAAICKQVMDRQSLNIELPNGGEMFHLEPYYASMSDEDCLKLLEDLYLGESFKPAKTAKEDLKMAESLDSLYVVTGRIYGDDDDTVYLVKARSQQAAQDRFWDQIHDDQDIPAEDRRRGDDPTAFIISCESFKDMFAGALTADDMHTPSPAQDRDDDGMSP